MDPTKPPANPSATVTNPPLPNQASNTLPPLPPSSSSPTVYTTASVNDVSTPPKAGFSFKLPLILIGIFLLLTLTAGGVLAGVAYEKIDIHNSDLQRKISQFVMGIPLTPKTPRFLLESATLAQTKVSKYNFDISLAAKSNSLASLSLSELDAEAKGDIDYSDPQNLKISANASVTKDFNADLRKNDSTMYVKINKIPDYLFTYAHLDKNKILPVFDNWIAIDTKTLNTQASQEMNKNDNSSSSLTDDLVDKTLLPALKVSDDSVDTHQTYLLKLDADDQMVDTIMNNFQNKMENNARKNELKVNPYNVKPSDSIKNLKVQVWIDKSSYLVRKASTSFDYQPAYPTNSLPTQVLGASQTPMDTVLQPFMGIANMFGYKMKIPELTQVPFSSATTLGSNKTSIVMVVKFDKFGESFTVDTPSTSIKPEEFYQKLAQASGYADQLSSAQGKARDSKRMVDIQSLGKGLIIYKEENGKFPSTLDVLKPKYITSVPVDPLTQQSYDYRPNAAKTAFTLSAKLEDGTTYQVNEKGQSTILGKPTTQSTLSPNQSSANASMRFLSLGPESVETGIRAQMTSATQVGSQIKATVNFTNYTTSSLKFAPIHLSMSSGNHGYPNKESVLSVSLDGGQSVTLSFTFDKPTDPSPYTFMFDSTTLGKQIVLGTLS